MGMIDSFFLMISKWFGYVGACMFVPDATCRPFLAFVALGAAACAALTLVVMAYLAAQREAAPAETKGLRTEATTEIQERPQRRFEPRITARPAVQPRLRAAA